MGALSTPSLNLARAFSAIRAPQFGLDQAVEYRENVRDSSRLIP
jgi:hypothetical protein